MKQTSNQKRKVKKKLSRNSKTQKKQQNLHTKKIPRPSQPKPAPASELAQVSSAALFCSIDPSFQNFGLCSALNLFRQVRHHPFSDCCALAPWPPARFGGADYFSGGFVLFFLTLCESRLLPHPPPGSIPAPLRSSLRSDSSIERQRGNSHGDQPAVEFHVPQVTDVAAPRLRLQRQQHGVSGVVPGRRQRLQQRLHRQR